MRIEAKFAIDGYRTLLNLTPDLYDGHPPLESIQFHSRVRVADPNLTAVSVAIALRGYVAESLEFDDSVQAHVAEAIEEFMAPRRFRVSPVEKSPAALPKGGRTAVIGSNDPGCAGLTRFTMSRGSSLSSFMSMDEIHIATNLSQFLPDDDTGFALASLACAVFVAADYRFGRMRLCGDAAASIDGEEAQKLKRLLASVNIKLDVVATTQSEAAAA